MAGTVTCFDWSFGYILKLDPANPIDILIARLEPIALVLAKCVFILGHPKFASSFDAGVKTAMTKRGFVGVCVCVWVCICLSMCVLCTLKYRKHNTFWFEAFLSLPSRKLTYPSKMAYLKMIFLFPRWDMLIPWRVTLMLGKMILD